MSSLVALESTANVSPNGRWLSPLREHWASAICRVLKQEAAVVRVVIAATRGSSPREAGACMLVTRDRLEGTVGGGHLEWEAMRAARVLLCKDRSSKVQTQRMTLGRDLAQCCGGEIYLWMERYERRDLPVLREISDAAAQHHSLPFPLPSPSPASGRGEDCASFDSASPLPLASPLPSRERARERDLPDGNRSLSHALPSPSPAGGRGEDCVSFDSASALPLASPLPSRERARERAAPLLITYCNGMQLTRHLLRSDAATYKETNAQLSETASGIALFGAGEELRLLERIESMRTPLWLYGAGHVAQALTRILADLPFEIIWIDSRAELIPGALPNNVRAIQTDAPIELIRTAPRAMHHLVMTHDHGLDYLLCREILSQNRFASLGLIGSKSKAARFRSQLKRDGMAAELIAKLISPIGVEGIASKLPAAIAVGIAARLLQQIGTTAAKIETPSADAECAGKTCTNCLTHGESR